MTKSFFHQGFASRGMFSRLLAWARANRIARLLAVLLGAGALGSALLTYIAVTGSSNPFGPDPRTVVGLMLLNMVLLVALAALVGRRAFYLWHALRSGSEGTRLQTRILVMFSLGAIIPTVTVAVFSTLFFTYGLQSWFDTRVSTAIEESVAVAEAYLKEHRELIRADAAAMSNDLESELYGVFINPARFQQIVNTQVALRSLSEAMVFQKSRILAQSRLSFSLAFEQLPADAIERAQNGEVVVLLEDEDRVRALIALKTMPDTFLLVGRLVDSRVLNHMVGAQSAVNEYRQLNSEKLALQLKFSVVFVLLALLLLVVALWYGMMFAARLTAPIGSLAKAAERVRAGDYAVRVSEGDTQDEIGSLARAFNRMTGELETQRTALMSANRELDARRRFSEAVLAGVSAGVLALDAEGAITLANRTAEALLKPVDGEEAANLLGQPAEKFLPELKELLAQAALEPGKRLEHTLTLAQREKPLTLQLRLTAEAPNAPGRPVSSYILTLDDITALVTAQRSAAWADVARRVAHEIKNPLTPIQLAAERLRKKFMPYVPEEEAESYARYTETISRHVRDIGRMVEEFVSFARMPSPVLKPENLTLILRKTMFSEQCAHPEIAFTLDAPEAPPLMLLCDERQLGQAFLNLLKNAAEAIENRPQPETDAPPLPSGAVHIRAYEQGDKIIVEVRDNGPGIPAELIERVMEPHVSTRARGSGLGLAIVKKTIEDHKGLVQIANNSDGGTLVVLSFSKIVDINATGDASSHLKEVI